jgi:beta-lysine 5,6-aminomutase alpha subunit
VPAPGGLIEQRAKQVLGESLALLRRINDEGLLTAIAEGTFGITKRPADGGRGLEGVVSRADDYFNPASEILEGGERAPAGGLQPTAPVEAGAAR